KQLERRLRSALQSFDEAPIFTIHGFCARVLTDRAFESGVSSEVESVSDQSRFLNEIADDFWRAHFYGDDTVMAKVLRGQLTPARLVELLVQLTNNPTLRVTPPPENRSALKKKIIELCEAGSDDEEIQELAKRFIVSLESEFCGWAVEELRQRKRDRRV